MGHKQPHETGLGGLGASQGQRAPRAEAQRQGDRTGGGAAAKTPAVELSKKAGGTEEGSSEGSGVYSRTDRGSRQVRANSEEQPGSSWS